MTAAKAWVEFTNDYPLVAEKLNQERMGKVVTLDAADQGNLQKYRDRFREIQAETQARTAELLFRWKAIHFAETMLSEYRLPLVEMGCDGFLKALAAEPPSIGVCSETATFVTLHSGSLRYVHRAPAATGKEPRVQVGGRVIVPDGTEFVAETTEDGAQVRVIEGRVTVYEPGGKAVTRGEGPATGLARRRGVRFRSEPG